MIWGGSTRWRGGWWGVGSEQLGLERKPLMAVLSDLALACLIHVGM